MFDFKILERSCKEAYATAQAKPYTAPPPQASTDDLLTPEAIAEIKQVLNQPIPGHPDSTIAEQCKFYLPDIDITDVRSIVRTILEPRVFNIFQAEMQSGKSSVIPLIAVVCKAVGRPGQLIIGATNANARSVAGKAQRVRSLSAIASSCVASLRVAWRYVVSRCET